MLRQVLRGAGLAAGVVAFVAASGAAGPAFAAPAPSPAQPTSLADAGAKGVTRSASAVQDATLARQNAMLPVAQALTAQSRTAGSDIAGVRLDAAAGVVHVYRTDTGRGLSLAAGVPAGVQVVVHQARFSRATMEQAGAAISHDAQALGQQHVSVQAFGPAVDGSGLDVSVVAGQGDSAAVAGAASVLRARYGAVIGQVTGAARQAANQGLYFAGFRFNDFAPWYGADRIESSSAGCTSGVAANYNGGPVMLTASHCGAVGTSWYNGPRSNGSFSFMGTTVYSNTATDIAAISVSSYTRYINVGYNPQTPTQVYTNGWASPVVGQYLCQSGSYTGERCGLRVVDTNQSVCLSWVLWWCTFWQGPLADVISIYGPSEPAAGHGDSGAPVYRYDTSSSVTAEGLVHGQLTPNAHAAFPAYFPDTLACPAPEGTSNRCSAGFSFADMPGY